MNPEISKAENGVGMTVVYASRLAMGIGVTLGVWGAFDITRAAFFPPEVAAYAHSGDPAYQRAQNEHVRLFQWGMGRTRDGMLLGLCGLFAATLAEDWRQRIIGYQPVGRDTLTRQ